MFDTKNLNVLSYSNTFTLWHYKTEDKIDKIRSPNYFDEVNEVLNANDFLFVNANDINCIAFITVSKEKIILTCLI